jgi:serine/threonine protein kinase
MTLQGQSVEAIGKAVGKSERTVRRLLARARTLVENRLTACERSPTARPATVPEALVKQYAQLQYGDYVLEQLLGAGGMGKVYRATERSSGDRVAVKALHKSRQLDSRAVVQFIQEARILAGLNHPNIVKVRGLGQFPGGGLFIVVEYIDGCDLQTQLMQGPLPLDKVLEIIKQVKSPARCSMLTKPASSTAT